MRLLTMVIIVLIAIIGQIINIYKFAKSDFEEPYRPEIIRAVGIPVAPLGVIIGYMKLEGEK